MRELLSKWGLSLFLIAILLSGAAISLLPASVLTVGGLRPVVIIDAGHGAPDGGAVGADGTQESDVNLDIANRLYDLCMMFCLPAERTRTTQSGLWDADDSTIREKKRSDLTNRRDFVASFPGAVLISIHQNAYTGYARGAQVYARAEDTSRALADSITAALTRLEGFPTRDATKIPKGLYLFENTACPAVIVESGYMSDPSDLALMKDPAWREGISLAILQGYLAAEELF
ncbi:MAG: N-acetylmuramoyl-L-alanine amidase [Clostridia bacterium]|nr:N-acetylmuramoyl-L-alanine amidase [Clostridia bacterium]